MLQKHTKYFTTYNKAVTISIQYILSHPIFIKHGDWDDAPGVRWVGLINVFRPLSYKKKSIQEKVKQKKGERGVNGYVGKRE